MVKFIQGLSHGPAGRSSIFGGGINSNTAALLEQYRASGDKDAAQALLGGTSNTSTQNNNMTINQTNNIQTSESGPAVEKAMKDNITKFRKWTPYTT